MRKVHLIFLCFVVAKSVLCAEEHTAVKIVGLYNDKLKFFNSFLSPSSIDGIQLSTRNIDLETVKSLRAAAIPYSSLYGIILSRCIVVNNTVEKTGQSCCSIGDNRPFLMEMYKELMEMKKHFDAIATVNVDNEQVKDYEAVITISGNVKRLQVIRGKTPKTIEDLFVLLWPILDKARNQANITEYITPTTLNDNVVYAKKIIAEAISTITHDTDASFVRQSMIDKCRPLYNTMSPPSTSQTQYTTPSPKIEPSMHDTLKGYPGACQRFTSSTKCEAMLSKSTMDQLLNLYRSDVAVAEFFDSIDSSGALSGCGNRIKSFIKKSYLDWGYEVQKLRNRQFLKFSFCLDSDAKVAVTIVN